MSDEADRFRFRATQCRELAKAARDEYARQTLSQIADDLEAEADNIDAAEPVDGSASGAIQR